MSTNAQHVDSKSWQQETGKGQALPTPDAQNRGPTLWDDDYTVSTPSQAQCRYCWMSWSSASSQSTLSLQLHKHFCPGRSKRLAEEKKQHKLGKCPGHLPKDPTPPKKTEWQYEGKESQPPELSQLTLEQIRERFLIDTKGFRLKAQCRDCDRKVCNRRKALCAHLAGCALRRKFSLLRDEKKGRWAKCRDCGAVVKPDRGTKMVHFVKECPTRTSWN